MESYFIEAYNSIVIKKTNCVDLVDLDNGNIARLIDRKVQDVSVNFNTGNIVFAVDEELVVVFPFAERSSSANFSYEKAKHLAVRFMASHADKKAFVIESNPNFEVSSDVNPEYPVLEVSAAYQSGTYRLDTREPISLNLSESTKKAVEQWFDANQELEYQYWRSRYRSEEDTADARSRSKLGSIWAALREWLIG